jgi:D-sedoheptulose 7-phosphate isomerase
VEEARRSGLHIVALTGKGGGKIADLVDLEIRVPSSDTARIQESHITVGHLLCQLVEDSLFPEQGSP